MTPQDASTPTRASERNALACASATIFLGGFGLLGWMTPWRGLARIDPASIPMAPSTALALLLLGGTLMLETRRRLPRLTTAVSLLVSVFGCVQLVTFLAGLSPMLDALFVPAPDLFGGFPTGRMSPWTALGLLLSSLSVLFIGRAHRHPALGSAGGSLAVVVCLLGVVVTLGYLFGAPLLYGSSVVPMPLLTGVAMGCLGLTLVGLSPRDSALLRPFTGSSARATLLRAFLPVAPAIVVVELLFEQVEGLNPALHAALTALLSAFVVAAVVSYAAHGVSRELDRAQAGRDRLAVEVHQKQQFLQSVLDGMPAVVFVKDRKSRFTLVNAAWERFTGVPRDEAAGKTARYLFPVDVADRLRRQDVATFNANARTETEEILPSDHGPRTYLTSRFPLRSEEGRIEGLVGLAVDITERKRAEDRLREYERVVEGLDEMIMVVDREFRYLLVNRAYLNYRGMARDEIIGRLVADLLGKELFEREVRKNLEESLKGKVVRYELRYDYPELGQRDLCVSYFPIEGLAGVERVACVLQDITERKRAGEALQRADAFAESIIQTANVIFLQLDAAGIVRKLNAAAEEITGYTRAEVEGRPWFEVVVPRDRYPSAWEEFVRLMTEGVTAGGFEHPILNKQGEERQIMWRNTTLRQGDQIVGMISFGMDVTDRQRAEEQQARLSEALQALSRRLVSAHETERREIARELHDEAGQLLTGLKLLIGTADLDASGEAFAASQLKRDLTFTLDELLTAIRDISTRLRPPMLDGLGLVPTLTWHVQRFAAITGVRVRLDCHATTKRRFGAEVELAAYRLVQESLTNVARHAKTDTAGVELRADGTTLQVRVIDSGRGFSPSEKLHGSSLGLLGMRERCLALGGQLSIDSSPGAGTIVIAELPLEPGTVEACP